MGITAEVEVCLCGDIQATSESQSSPTIGSNPTTIGLLLIVGELWDPEVHSLGVQQQLWVIDKGQILVEEIACVQDRKSVV